MRHDIVSPTLVRRLELHDDPPATDPPAKPSGSDGKNTGGGSTVPQPPAATGGDAPASTEGDGKPPAEPVVTLTEAQLKEATQAAVTAALKDHATRQANAQRRQQNQTARQAAEASGDAQALLDVEIAEHTTTREERDTAIAERDQARRELVVYRVSNRHGLDEELTALLVNNSAVVDEATAEVEAAKLAKFKKLPDPPANDSGNGNRPKGQKGNGNNNGDGGQNRNGKRGDNGRRYAFQSAGEVPWPDND